MKRKDYKKYWENVVKAWFTDNTNDASYKKEKEVVLGNFALKEFISEQHMPEPYWGNPNKASFVILNYNPGGGDGISPHTYKNCLDCKSIGHTLLNYVNKHGYFKTAEKFPLLSVRNDIDSELKDICANYGGSVWWEKKREWLENIAKAASKDINAKPPFAMELCGWHSKRWDSNVLKNLSNGNGLKQHIEDTVISPMLDILKASETFAVCIGKGIGDFLVSLGFQNTTPALCKFIGISVQNATADHINVTAGHTKALHSGETNKKGRNYRLLEKDGCYVINTWVHGSNVAPSTIYKKLEGRIIDYIINE